jgi:predicted nucleic acid-binding protein
MTESGQRIVVDTGPLVALLSGADQYQEWARKEFERLSPPVFTCEAVLSEAQLLLQARGGNPRAVW